MSFRLFFTALLVNFLLPGLALAQTFTFSPPNTVTGCTPSLGMSDCGQIPSDNAGTPVTAIAASAFTTNFFMGDVVIPASIVTIGDRAFFSVPLSSLTLNEGLQSIGNEAFAGAGLSGVLNLPESLLTIGVSAFASNFLTGVNIPSQITEIPFGAFFNNRISTLNLPPGITRIGEYAFQRNNLTTLVLPQSLQTIDDHAFEVNQLSSISIPDGVDTIGVSAFVSNTLTRVEFSGARPASISNDAFDGNDPAIEITYLQGQPGWPGSPIGNITPTLRAASTTSGATPVPLLPLPGLIMLALALVGFSLHRRKSA